MNIYGKLLRFTLSGIMLFVSVHSHAFQQEELNNNPLTAGMNPFAMPPCCIKEANIFEHNVLEYEILPSDVPFAVMSSDDPNDDPNNDPIGKAPAGDIPVFAVLVFSIGYIAVKQRNRLSRILKLLVIDNIHIKNKQS